MSRCDGGGGSRAGWSGLECLRNRSMEMDVLLDDSSSGESWKVEGFPEKASFDDACLLVDSFDCDLCNGSMDERCAALGDCSAMPKFDVSLELW